MSLRVSSPTAGLVANCNRLLSHGHRPTSQLLRCLYSTASVSSRHGRPFRMAVIGSGPAGFYTSYRVMSLVEGAKIDMYESLPVPFGLVRFGVAPDHPEVKNCGDKFTEVASSPNFTFIGNVAVGHAPSHPGGQSVPLRSLLRHYDAVLFAYGASKDRSLGIPGESSLRRIYSAREFVGWYNGLPEFAGLDPDLSQESAVIIGQGNVALDVARILLEDVDRLRKTDMAAYALEALAASRVRRVSVVGRRAPMQAAFTIKELREMMNLPGVGFRPVQRTLVPGDLKSLPRARRRLMEVLVKGSVTPLEGAPKSWDLGFCLSPTAFHPHSADPSAVGATSFQHNVLNDTYDTSASVQGTEGEPEVIDSPLVFRSIGYKSEAIPEFRDLGVAFDERRGVIANDGVHGRVIPANRDTPYFPGLYCAGWVKRGPTGVIASTMEDAFATAAAIAADWKAGAAFLADGTAAAATAGSDRRAAGSAGWEGVRSEGGQDLARGAVGWEGWLAIDRAEREKGRQMGKEREKFTTIDDMLPLSTSTAKS